MSEFSRKFIYDTLPHRPPFLMVDAITELTPGESVKGFKLISNNEPYFDGHFPDLPVFPGVLMCEALAQVSGFIFQHMMKDNPDNLMIYSGIDKVKFKGMVIPGDKLLMTSKFLRKKAFLYIFECEAFSEKPDGSVSKVCTATIQLALTDKKSLRS